MMNRLGNSIGPAPVNSGLRFAGLHPEAVVGADVKAAGVTAYNDNNLLLFTKLKHFGKLAQYTHRTLHPLVLKREPDNKQDAQAVGIYVSINGEDKKIGMLPKTLTPSIAPLMDKGNDFHATLTKLEPFQYRGKRHYQPVIRLEYTATPGVAPDTNVGDTVVKAFTDARETQPKGFDQVLTVVPETLNTFSVRGKELMERINHERSETTYYMDGVAITRVKMDHENPAKPDYQGKKIPKSIQDKVAERLDLLV